MQSANERQVGGEHYQGEFQHWDLVYAIDLDYFEGQITKYVGRARKKNGLQDYEKGLHFLDKYIELNPPAPQRSAAAIDQYLPRYLAGRPDLQGWERDVIARICRWRKVADLRAVRLYLAEHVERLR